MSIAAAEGRLLAIGASFSAAIESLRLPDRDSNPDSTIQSRVSYRWTIRHSLVRF